VRLLPLSPCVQPTVRLLPSPTDLKATANDSSGQSVSVLLWFPADTPLPGPPTAFMCAVAREPPAGGFRRDVCVVTVGWPRLHSPRKAVAGRRQVDTLEADKPGLVGICERPP